MKKKNVFKWWGVVLLLCMCSEIDTNPMLEQHSEWK